ncbi:uncharacterized protein LOC124155813 [Ischnura elegans]|uniref:uncharacterized protein LOC124155813 n=1 Tax=Ischnura elegans TaxID=197161 RepID=UPI001ED88A03|nr:uncharacterized protein LOC124155813 [Ischnura elegans]
MDGYSYLILGFLMVAAATPASTVEPSRMTEGRMFAETMRQALKRPGVADSLGQILPFLRVMPTRQRDQLAVMIRSALRPNLPLPPDQEEEQEEAASSDYVLDQPSTDGGEDLLASAASPTNSIASGTAEGDVEVVGDLKQMSMKGGLPAMMDFAQSARRSNSTGVLEKLLPNLDIVNLLKETVASVDDNGAGQGRDFQSRFGLPSGDLRRSGVGGETRPPVNPPRRLKSPPGTNRRHSVLTSKGNGPPSNLRPPKPYDKIVRQTSQSSRRVIMGGRDKVRPFSGSSHKNHLPPVSIGNESFKNHLQAQAGCRYFGPTVCLSVDYYPREAILSSIRQKKGFAEALLSNDLRVGGLTETNPVSNQEEFSVCPSEVLPAARPQKAMTKNGVWKFIVNVDDLYAQTLRMEACSRPGHQCIHVAPSQGEPFFTTSCNQVRNLHKLLAWDENRGIHVDSFEIPTCCSCHITTVSKPQQPPFSMSTSYTASTSTRPATLLHPPPSFPKRKRPFFRGSSPAPVFEEDDDLEEIDGEVVAAESSPPKRGVGPVNIREGLQHYRTTPSPPLGPPLPTTPLLPRPLSPVAVQETWPQKPLPPLEVAPRPPTEPQRPPQHIPERHQPTSTVSHVISSSDNGQSSSPQRINYSYHPIFDFFRAGRLKDVHPEDEEAAEKDEVKPTEAILSRRSDNLEVQGHSSRPNFGDGWSPIIPPQA